MKHIEGLNIVLNWWKGTKECFNKKDEEWKDLCAGEKSITHAIQVLKRLEDREGINKSLKEIQWKDFIPTNGVRNKERYITLHNNARKRIAQALQDYLRCKNV